MYMNLSLIHILSLAILLSLQPNTALIMQCLGVGSNVCPNQRLLLPCLPLWVTTHVGRNSWSALHAYSLRKYAGVKQQPPQPLALAWQYNNTRDIELQLHHRRLLHECVLQLRPLQVQAPGGDNGVVALGWWPVTWAAHEFLVTTVQSI